jgi:hypothetical protein
VTAAAKARAAASVMSTEQHAVSNALIYITPSLNVSRPESVSVRETQFSRYKHLGTEGVWFVPAAPVC